MFREVIIDQILIGLMKLPTCGWFHCRVLLADQGPDDALQALQCRFACPA